MMRKKRWIIFATMLALATLGYGVFSAVGPYGYCRGWWGEWGKENLLMRALWLCRCSPEFEQSLYPENIDVLVSACECAEDIQSIQSSKSLTQHSCPPKKVYPVPGDNLLLVDDELIDLYTYKRTNLSLPIHARFVNWLSEDLLVVRMWDQNGESSDYIYNRSTQRSENLLYVIDEMDRWDAFLQQAQLAKQIFVIDGRAFLLHVKSGNDLESNIVYADTLLPETNNLTIESILDNENISYISVLNEHSIYFPESPNRMLLAKEDGIYGIDNNKMLDYGLLKWSQKYIRSDRNSSSSGYYGFYPELWRSDSKAIVLEEFQHAIISYDHPIYVIFDFLPEYTGIIFYVDFPQPVLLFKLPDE